MIKKILMLLLVFLLTSCNSVNSSYNSEVEEQLNYEEPNENDIDRYIEFYNYYIVKTMEERIDKVYKDFGSYDGHRLIWFISVKGTEKEREWYSVRVGELYFTFDYGDKIHFFYEITTGEGLFASNFTYDCRFLNDKQIAHFHQLYYDFVNSEKEKGNL